MPKTVMMENVPALLKDDRLQDVTREELESLGYTCAAKLFNAERFGVRPTSPSTDCVCLATRLPALCHARCVVDVRFRKRSENCLNPNIQKIRCTTITVRRADACDGRSYDEFPRMAAAVQTYLTKTN